MFYGMVRLDSSAADEQLYLYYLYSYVSVDRVTRHVSPSGAYNVHLIGC